jgi:hypothetical protein
MARILAVVGLLTAIGGCGNEASSTSSDGGTVDAAPDAPFDPCERNATRDACLAAAGCGWYSEPMCGTGTPLPLPGEECFTSTLGAIPECTTNDECGSGQLCTQFSGYEECGARTTCPSQGLCGIVSALCYPLAGN